MKRLNFPKMCTLFALLISLILIGIVSTNTLANSAGEELFLPMLNARSAYTSSKIAVDSSDGLLTLNSDGTQQRMTSTDGNIVSLLWSPDRTQLAVSILEPNGISESRTGDVNVILVDPVTNEERTLIEGGTNWVTDWSAESGLLVSACNPALGRGVFTMIPGGSPSDILSENNNTPEGCEEDGLNFFAGRGIRYNAPKYMPDGSIFLFPEIIGTDGRVESISSFNNNIFTSSDDSPIAPDGTIYVGTDLNTGISATQGVIMEFDQSNNQWIETFRLDEGLLSGDIRVSPDGQQIGFTASESWLVNPRLYVLNRADNSVRLLTPDFDVMSEAGSFDWSPDSTQIAVGIVQEGVTSVSYQDDFADLYVIDVQTGERSKISDVTPFRIKWAD